MPWKEKNLDYEIETSRTNQNWIQLSTWKEKNLDYEIETADGRDTYGTYFTWKEKNLDYEIETTTLVACFTMHLQTWKEKNLDYEIETVARGLHQTLLPSLKRKEPRLRDWN